MRRAAHLLSVLLCLVWIFPEFDPATHAQTESPQEQITVILKDFQVHPNKTQTTAGGVLMTAVNEGMSLHELVILRTDLNPAKLPRKEARSRKGTVTAFLVDENDARIVTIDEIEEFPAGTSQKKIVSLEPGPYVLFCNIPGHYDKGMYASFNVMPQ